MRAAPEWQACVPALRVDLCVLYVYTQGCSECQAQPRAVQILGRVPPIYIFHFLGFLIFCGRCTTLVTYISEGLHFAASALLYTTAARCCAPF